MNTILLFYKYTSISDTKQLAAWQRELCTKLGVKGRIIIASEGINGTISGTTSATDAYIKEMRTREQFADIDFKKAASNESEPFPRLSIKIRDCIVNLGIKPEQCPLSDGGIHLTPEEAHQFISQRDDNAIILDARNAYESRIGTFKNAITPDIKNFRELPEYIDRNLEQFKDKDVFMYCTGGIRCERASAYLKRKGIARNVYQIEGGIHRYAEQFPDGYFRGKNYVFDGRISARVTNDVLTQCDRCQEACDTYTNCINALCSKHCIMCETCRAKYANTCSDTCHTKIVHNEVPARTYVHATE